MKIGLSFVLLLMFLILVWAGPKAPADQTGEATPETEASAAGTEESTTSVPEPVESFVPSEKLPADSAISFPVDI